MKRIIGLLSILVTATLILFTNDTSEFMLIVYLLILYLGNSFLVSNQKGNDLVPLLTSTELFYIIDFYLFTHHSNAVDMFAFLAIAFSFLTIVCLIKPRGEEVKKVEIEDEAKKYKKAKTIALVALLGALIFNIIMLALVDYKSVNCMYEIIMLVMLLAMTVIIIYQGFIASEKKNRQKVKMDTIVVSTIGGTINVFNSDDRQDKKYTGRFISNRPYFILSMFYLLFLPIILHNANDLMRMLYVYFLAYIIVIMYYPLAKCEYYGFRKNDDTYRLSFKEHLKKTFVYDAIFLLCGMTIAFSIFYGYNRFAIHQDSSGKLNITNHDADLYFEEEDKDRLEQAVRADFNDVAYVAFEEKHMELTNSKGEKYKTLTIYAYSLESNDVYMYTYYIYTTGTSEHELGEIEEVTDHAVADFTKDQVDNFNYDFS